MPFVTIAHNVGELRPVNYRRRAHSSTERKKTESELHDDGASPNSTMMSYAFTSFSPRQVGTMKQEKRLHTYSNHLLRRSEELQELALSYDGSQSFKEAKTSGSSEEQSNLVSERMIKNWVGKTTYSLGLKHFALGLVSERSSERNVIRSNIIDENSKSKYASRVEFKQGGEESSYHHLSAWCDCLSLLKGNKKACSHITALLLAWAREPLSFEIKPLNSIASIEDRSRFLSDLSRKTDRVFSALEEMISFILTEKSCREGEVLDMLQMLYSSTKDATNRVANRWNNLSPKAKKEEYEMILGFSFISSVVISRVLTAIDVKYKIGAMKWKNQSDVNAIRNIIGRFAKEPNALFDSKVALASQETKEKNNMRRTKDGRLVSRSWDKIVAEFASG